MYNTCNTCNLVHVHKQNIYYLNIFHNRDKYKYIENIYLKCYIEK